MTDFSWLSCSLYRCGFLFFSMEIPGPFYIAYVFTMLLYRSPVCNATCRDLDYSLQQIKGKALKGHVIKTVDVIGLPNCMITCFMEDRCVSINVGPSAKKGFHLCELNDSDNVLHPEDMEEKDGYLFRAAKNPCNTHPCPGSNTTCLNGFTDKGYFCQCILEGYTGEFCNEDVDECATKTHQCDPDAVCNNVKGSYSCSCIVGFTGDGLKCTDVNECALGVHGCHADAICKNTEGSHECVCKDGFAGDGSTCSDVDECATKTHQCDPNAVCNNMKGSYSCSCKVGFTGDGLKCTDINECALGIHGCHADATCKNTEGSRECACKEGLVGDGVKNCSVAKNCADINETLPINGVYTINPDGQGAFQVYCLQDYRGGGFVVIQNRSTGDVDFYLGWDDYKNGFGNLGGEFWLGLDKIHRLTDPTKNELHVRLEDWEGGSANAVYEGFKVQGEDTHYKMSFKRFVEGSAGNSLGWHNGRPFSTKDRDNDKLGGSCSQIYKGAWWYSACHASNLNGRYHQGGHHSSFADGINWSTWRGYSYSAKASIMIIRP